MLIYVKLQDLYGFCMQSIQPRTRPQIYIHVAIALWRLQCEWCWYYISMGVPVFGYSFFMLWLNCEILNTMHFSVTDQRPIYCVCGLINSPYCICLWIWYLLNLNKSSSNARIWDSPVWRGCLISYPPQALTQCLVHVPQRSVPKGHTL